jgi:hypothetical protein
MLQLCSWRSSASWILPKSSWNPNIFTLSHDRPERDRPAVSFCRLCLIGLSFLQPNVLCLFKKVIITVFFFTYLKSCKLGWVCGDETICCFVGEDKTGKESKKHCHKKELRRIRRKFGLESSDGSTKAISAPGYEDRAQIRRITVGSQNDHEKTRIASLEE